MVGQRFWHPAIVLLFVSSGSLLAEEEFEQAGFVFEAGAASVDITPPKFPVIVNGHFEERTADRAFDKLHSRALVFDDGQTRIAIVVVDSCGLPRTVCDAAKELAAKRANIKVDHICISATHTHSAPSVWPVLGSDADADYTQFLIPQIARSIEEAVKNLQPAVIGFAVVRDEEHTFCRRWIRRPDRLITDPFGEPTARAHMHPGHQNPDAIGPSGPTDPDISILSVRSKQGAPIAVLANYSMHYFGSPLVSADYFGRFCDELERLIGPGCVAIMSQGTSGDQMWMDYGKPAPKADMDEYAKAIAKRVFDAMSDVSYGRNVTLAMYETILKLNRRVPDEKRLAWAKPIVEQLAGRKPRSLPEIYAREQLLLAENPTIELKLQAIRIGNVCMTAIPNEVFAITGLKLKLQSPSLNTFNITLANGAEGYIPPPEQHALGGYTTWPARSAALEVEAEPKIVKKLSTMLDQVSGEDPAAIARPFPRITNYGRHVVSLKPLAYWPMDDIDATRCEGIWPNHRDAEFEPGVALYLLGTPIASDNYDWGGSPFRRDTGPNRAAHFAGGRVKRAFPELKGDYSVEFWFWNGLPHDARPVTGYMFSRGVDGDRDALGDHLGIGGTYAGAGRLIYFNGNKQNQLFIGTTPLALKTWYHAALVRSGNRVEVYLDGDLEISGIADNTLPTEPTTVFFGGRNDRFASFEGKLDEIVLCDRQLDAEDLHHRGTVAAQSRLSRPVPVDASKLGKNIADDLGPQSADDAAALMEVAGNFDIELVAAEPLTFDPIAIDWGPDGKLWIAEMADYHDAAAGKVKSGGRIRFLEDRDGDGHFDRSKLFLDGVDSPTGVMAWREGVLIAAEAEVIYAADTDGDGKADAREVLYEGFHSATPQEPGGGLEWGLDGWVYLPGSASGNVKSLKSGKTIDVAGHNVRIQPDSGDIEVVVGASGSGRCRDDDGNWFGCDPNNPMWHCVLDERFVPRNPNYKPQSASQQLIMPVNPPVFAISKPQPWDRPEGNAVRCNWSCSPMIYRDDLLFPGDRERGIQHAFVCDPAHNLIQHRVLSPRGVSFEATRADDEGDREFLASADSWFRPMSIRTGPDGALWIVDMYRCAIEHREPEAKKRWETYRRLGEDRGRIYRLLPSGSSPPPIPRLDKLKSAGLLARLESPNGTVRDLAQRLLVWRGNKSVVMPLRRRAVESENGAARLYALSTLALVDTVPKDLTLQALDDEDSAVVRYALRLCESHADDAEVLSAVIGLIVDPDPAVQLQLACTLGAFDDERAAKMMAKIAIRGENDPYVLSAVMSSLTAKNIGTVMNTIATSGKPALVEQFSKQAKAFEK